MTATGLVAEAGAALAAAGVPSPEWDAERLLRHVLGWDRATLVASSRDEVAPEAEARFRTLVGERARRVPLQHLVGAQEFWRLELVVTPDVLVPRPETEVLVEVALDLARGTPRPVVVDVGTGSGCVALAIAAERPDAAVYATDVSAPALGVARENRRRLGLDERVVLLEGHLLRPVEGLAGPLDLVVSNPPYVDESERDGLAPEVLSHEPAVALFPPGDALSVYRELVPASAAALRPGGALAVEVSPLVAGAVRGLFESEGFAGVGVREDLAGRPRVVLGRRGVG